MPSRRVCILCSEKTFVVALFTPSPLSAREGGRRAQPETQIEPSYDRGGVFRATIVQTACCRGITFVFPLDAILGQVKGHRESSM